MSTLEESRARVERSFSQLSVALRSEVGIAPRTLSWALPLSAFAVGFAMAALLLRRGRRTPDRTNRHLPSS